MSSLFPLLIGVVFELDHFIEVVGSRLFLDVLDNKILKFHFAHFK